MSEKPYKHSWVVDADGFYVILVLVLLDTAPDGSEKENIQYYTLGEGESLVDTPPPSGLIKKRWDGTAWVEGATPEEIAAENDKPIPPPAPPTPEQLAIAQLMRDVAVIKAKEASVNG